jgi:DNA polymerase-3 subunit alpha
MFVPIQNTTHFSLLNSISTPESLCKRADELGYKSLGLTDYNSISGAVEFMTECKKKKIKPILGTKLRIDNEQYITLISKNLNGWKNLLKIISASHDVENHINGKAALSYQKFSLRNLSDIILILGDLESEMFHQCFSLYGFTAKDEAEAKIGISANVKDRINDYIDKYRNLFNKDDIFVQVNLLNNYEIPYQKLIADILRESVKDVKVIAGINSHYTNRTDSTDHRLLMCSDQKTTFGQIDYKYWKNSVFFRSNGFHLPSQQEVESLYLPKEIENTELIDSMCEKYDITSKPRLPKFECPNGLSELEYLRKLARDGYSSKKKQDWDAKLYGDRANTELAVIDKAGLAGYFLIVADYIREAKSRGYLVGPARGSAAGSLICYLADITEVDPIPYKLIFERFYNEGRNSGDNIAYPDIDVDFPKFAREEVIEYVNNKYGKDKVGKMSTFGRLQGRSAIREVLRVHNACDMNTINQISKLLPHEHKIADRLEEDDEESIIRWTLINEPERLQEYVQVNDQGEILGDMANYFEQAIRIEKTYKSQGIHASGIVICDDVLADVSPMVWHQESGEKVIGFDMKSAEKCGLIKMDFLGVSILNKLMFVQNILKGNV